MATKEDLEIAKRKEEIKKIERVGKIAAWNEYTEFVVSKATGVFGTVIGGLEVLDPSIITANIPQPELFLGGGLALLAGKSALKLIIKIAKAFEK